MVCGICHGTGHNRRTCPQAVHQPAGHQPAGHQPAGPRVKVKAAPVVQLTPEYAGSKLAEIEAKRPEQYIIANECVEALNQNKNCLIRAEEKTGKRMIMEAIHLIMTVNHGCAVRPEHRPPRSIYVTALNRKDTKEQFREQQDEYGILSIVATKHAVIVGELIKILNDETNDGIFYIHLDECDYGTGSKQSLSKLYNSPELNIPEHRDRIRYVAYSATPEELEFSGLDMNEWVQHTFVPSDTYFGAKKYLESGLVFKPKKFFDGVADFSEHGQQIIDEVRENFTNTDATLRQQRNVIVVRDTGKGILHKIHENKQELMKKHGCEIHICDQNIGFGWSDKTTWGSIGKTEVRDGNHDVIGYEYTLVLIFIAQTCTRSTEIHPLGHRRIAVWHDARKLEEGVAYNTVSQAIGRVKHYSQEGYPENTIKLYCDKDILKQTIGLELSTKKLKLAQRIQTTHKKQNKVEFEGYDDEFTDVASVGDPDWQMGDPNAGLLRPKYHNVDGKWCQYDMKPRFWNDKNHGGSGGDAGRQTTIQYEKPTSDRWIRRVALYKRTENVQVDGNEFNHKTKKDSMFVK
jgi:hypothetical protein